MTWRDPAGAPWLVDTDWAETDGVLVCVKIAPRGVDGTLLPVDHPIALQLHNEHREAVVDAARRSIEAFRTDPVLDEAFERSRKRSRGGRPRTPWQVLRDVTEVVDTCVRAHGEARRALKTALADAGLRRIDDVSDDLSDKEAACVEAENCVVKTAEPYARAADYFAALGQKRPNESTLRAQVAEARRRGIRSSTQE